MHVSRFKYHLSTYYTVLQDSGDYLAVGKKEHNKVILKNHSFYFESGLRSSEILSVSQYPFSKSKNREFWENHGTNFLNCESWRDFSSFNLGR